MNGYICVYRHKTPSTREWKNTSSAGGRDPLLRAFLDGYDRSYYDWGDDPSFFAAQHLLGNVREATWGVCRRDVRQCLQERDLVVFFCGRQNGPAWHYYFIGFGSVKEIVARERLWTDPAYTAYRNFYNVLARLDNGRLVQHETFHAYHEDWEKRAASPYILFGAEGGAFNLESPHHVATYDGTTAPEVWEEDDRSREIERLLFVERGIDRRLRTSVFGYCHTKLNFVRNRGALRPGRGIEELRAKLGGLV